MKFDSGGLRMRDTDAMLPNQTTEEDVFRTLGLEWIRKWQAKPLRCPDDEPQPTDCVTSDSVSQPPLSVQQIRRVDLGPKQLSRSISSCRLILPSACCNILFSALAISLCVTPSVCFGISKPRRLCWPAFPSLAGIPLPNRQTSISCSLQLDSRTRHTIFDWRYFPL